MKLHPMTFWKIEYASETSIVQVVMCGVVTPRYARQLAAEMLGFAARHGAEKFLIDSRRIDIPRGTIFDVFNLPQTFEKLGFARGNRTAIVHRPCPKVPEIFQLFEAGYQHKGFALRFFTELEAASAWLRTKSVAKSGSTSRSNPISLTGEGPLPVTTQTANSGITGWKT